MNETNDKIAKTRPADDGAKPNETKDSLIGPAVPKKIARNINELQDQTATFGQKAADALAKQAGSWRFIFSFIVVLAIWIILNSVAFLNNWDPYPFILLNLLLSCLAAIQAPVIMMSQNRQESRDRLRADADYHINVKAELELERLHRKIDRLNSERVRDLLKLQEEQMVLLNRLIVQKEEKPAT